MGDELELLHAVKATMQVPSPRLSAVARHVAATAADALSCELAVLYLPAGERLAEQRRTEGSYAGVVVVDMNGLKAANDRRGHDFGDRRICTTADVISAAVGGPVSSRGSEATSSRSSWPRPSPRRRWPRASGLRWQVHRTSTGSSCQRLSGRDGIG